MQEVLIPGPEAHECRSLRPDPANLTHDTLWRCPVCATWYFVYRELGRSVWFRVRWENFRLKKRIREFESTEGGS